MQFISFFVSLSDRILIVRYTKSLPVGNFWHNQAQIWVFNKLTAYLLHQSIKISRAKKMTNKFIAKNVYNLQRQNNNIFVAFVHSFVGYNQILIQFLIIPIAFSYFVMFCLFSADTGISQEVNNYFSVKGDDSYAIQYKFLCHSFLLLSDDSSFILLVKNTCKTSTTSQPLHEYYAIYLVLFMERKQVDEKGLCPNKVYKY